MPFVNFLGDELNVGDLVAYPVLNGRSCQLEVAEIVELIAPSPDDIRNFEDSNFYVMERDPVSGHYTRVPVRGPSLLEAQQRLERFKREPFKVKLQSRGIGSRWDFAPHTDKNGKVKVTTVTSNAASLVKVSLDNYVPR